MKTQYELFDFMKYPNIAFKLSMAQPFTWSGSIKFQHQNHIRQFVVHLWFLFGAANLVYQNFGMLIYLFAPHQNEFIPTNGDDQLEQVPLVAQISETGGIMGLTLVGVCKMLLMFCHRRRIEELLEEFQQIFPRGHNQNEKFENTAPDDSNSSLYRVKYFASNSQLLMKRTTFFFMFAFCFYNSLPIVELIYEYGITDEIVKYRYQSNTWYPWQTKDNCRSWVNFIAAYICQFQSSLTGVAFIMAGEFMLCFFITQMQMHFDYVTNALENLDASDEMANDKLKNLIAYHIKLLRLSKEINNIFNISFLVNFTTSTIAICLMGFSMVMISMAHAIKFSVGLLSFLVFTLFICYNGSEFTKSSSELMPAAFYNNWYDGDRSYCRMILFFIMGCTEPNVLRAYKFTIVSMPTYMAILKFSYQLFTFIRTIS